ncbi:MAG: AAA family ATPase [Armatimonadetes bacterium]|nr:AAA family ATPase [Armatimonadota bacterium]
MLTRLKVSGFKNLVDVDVRFGPFTCIAGANAVGKSNLFDAIRFLSALADRPLIEAALSVRDERGRSSDLRDIFHRIGEHSVDRMSFEAEMIVPAEGQDDLGQRAKASITFLRYSVEIALRGEDPMRPLGGLELLKEELVHIKKGAAAAHLLFPHSTKWRSTAIVGPGRRSAFISTEGEGPERLIERHQEGKAGRTLQLRASDLPRTVLSAVRASESPTALLARREMQAWRLLQLEPSALRKPDAFTAPQWLGPDGSHLPATLYRLARSSNSANRHGASLDEEQVYARVANRLFELIGDVHTVAVDRDERRELLTLTVTGRDGTAHPARALSDGTLRFLALSVIELDPAADRLLCLEEPENGVHPERVPTMLDLLRAISTDSNEPAGEDNPLRQVIVNTHSPLVVGEVLDDALLVAESHEAIQDGRRFTGVRFSCLADTWRAKAPGKPPVVSRGKLLAYLNPTRAAPLEEETMPVRNGRSRRPRRVIDRPDLQPLLPSVSADV